ncbi:MAG: ATP-dependent Clp protease proteolytic subunit [Ignavibacteria bacterium]|nr:ATP-dependent Clp protease proteolytic subunit [Ignavibacteria bacterium]
MDQTEIVKKQSNSGRWFWGILIALISIAILFVGFSIIFFANMVSDNSRYDEVTGRGNGRIAVVDLDFTILSSESIVRQFKKFGEDKSIKAILLHVNTPGGGVAASQEMYEAIKKG